MSGVGTVCIREYKHVYHVCTCMHIIIAVTRIYQLFKPEFWDVQCKEKITIELSLCEESALPESNQW